MAEKRGLAVVTGGSRGIGAAIARRLTGDGWTVAVTGRSAGSLKELAAEIGGHALVCDLLDRKGTETMLAELAELGRVEVLVNNAGIANSAPLRKVSDADWDRTMELNATAPFRLCRALIPPMVDAGWGRVVTVASNAGVSGYKYTMAYCASKHAVVGMTRALAVELARTGVTVNCVCPGWVDTDMVREAVTRIAAKTGCTEDEARGQLAAMTPQGRILEAAEVAHAVAMLVADEAKGIHGQTVILDGGQVLK